MKTIENYTDQQFYEVIALCRKINKDTSYKANLFYFETDRIDLTVREKNVKKCDCGNTYDKDIKLNCDLSNPNGLYGQNLQEIKAILETYLI